MPIEIDLPFKGTFVLDKDLAVMLIIGALLFISFIVGFILGRRRKRKKENTGEAAVRKILTRYCRNTTAHLLNNVTLKYRDGTTQIDHILLTQNGIIVIETKHYSGWLFGHEAQKYWTQVIFKVKHRFQSPIMQNKKHIHAVRDVLNFLPKQQVQGLVVFTGEAELKTEMPENVIYLHQIEEYVGRIKYGAISENRLQFCIGRLEYCRFEITERTDVEHQMYLERKYGVVD